MASESSDWTLKGLDNPFTIQHMLLNRFREATGGVIVDNNNPASVLMEGFADLSGAQIRMMDDNVRPAIYPSRAETMEDILRHVSDYDYVDIFSSPCQAMIVLVVDKNYVMTHSVEVPGKNYCKIEIPRSTIIKIGEHTFGLYYPIEIRSDYKSGQFSVLYNDVDVNGNKVVNPLNRLETNVLDFEFREFNGHKLAYIRVPVYQFEITSHNSVLMNATGYKTRIPYTNKFYAIRCWADVLKPRTSLEQFTETPADEDYERKELNLAVSGQTYDPETPTVVFTPNVDSNDVLLEIPHVYFSNSKIRGTLHVEIYTTEGRLDYQVPYGTNETCSIDMISNISDDEEALFNATKYVEPIRQMPALNAYPWTSHIVGGSDGLSFEDIRKRVIYGVNSTLLQTPGDIDAYFANKGYTATLYRDGITDRVFIVHATVRDVEGTVVGADTIKTLIDFTKIDDYETIVKSDAANVYTVLPSTLYRFDPDKNICVPLTDVERTAIENMSPADKVKEFNSQVYTMSPFHIQINASDKYPSTITYDMLEVKRVSRRFIASRDERYGLALNGVNLDVDRRAGDVADRYRMTLRVARVGFGIDIPVMETDPESQGEKKIRVLIGLKNDDGEYRWTEALHIGNEAGDDANSDNEVFECYFTPNYIFHQANNEHTVQMAFWDNTNYSDFFLKSECRIMLLLRNSISFTDADTGEIVTFEGDQHLETPFNSGSIVLPTSKSTPITSESGMVGYVAMSEHACVFQFGSPVDELDQRIHLTYSEAVYKTHKTTKFRVLEDDVYDVDENGNIKVNETYELATGKFSKGKFYYHLVDGKYVQLDTWTVGEDIPEGTYVKKFSLVVKASKGTLKCLSVRAKESVYPSEETKSNYIGCTGLDSEGKEFELTPDSIQPYCDDNSSLTVQDAPLVPKFAITNADDPDIVGSYELANAPSKKVGLSSMNDVWKLVGNNANVENVKITTVNALKFVVDNLITDASKKESKSGDSDPLNDVGIDFAPGSFLVLSNDSSIPAYEQLGRIGEQPTSSTFTRLYYKIRNRSIAEVTSGVSESLVWLCIASSKTFETMVEAINADAEMEIPKYYGFAYCVSSISGNLYLSFLTNTSSKITTTTYSETKDTLAVASKSYFVEDGEYGYRLANESDFEDDGSFKSDRKYYEQDTSDVVYDVPDFKSIDIDAWESRIDYVEATEEAVLDGKTYAYKDNDGEYVILDTVTGTSIEDVAASIPVGVDVKRVYRQITAAEAIETGKDFGWELKGNRWPWDMTKWKHITQYSGITRIVDDSVFTVDQMFDRVRRYCEYSNLQVILDDKGKPLNDFEKPRYKQYLIDMMQLDAKLTQVNIVAEDTNVGSNFGDSGSTVNKYPSTVVTTLRNHFDNVGHARDSMFTNTRLFFEPVRSLGYAEFSVGNGSVRTLPLDIEIQFRLHVTKSVYEDDILLLQLRKQIVEIVDEHIESGGYVNCAEIANSIMKEMGGSVKYVDILGINGDRELQTMKSVDPAVRPHLKTRLVLLDDGITIDSERGIGIETVIND